MSRKDSFRTNHDGMCLGIDKTKKIQDLSEEEIKKISDFIAMVTQCSSSKEINN